MSKGSTALGPTGLSAANQTLLQVEAANNADAANQHFAVNHLKLYVEQ